MVALMWEQVQGAVRQTCLVAARCSRSLARHPAALTAAVVLVVLALPASALAGAPHQASSTAVDETRLMLLFAFIGLGLLTALLYDVFIGVDNRVSTSKTVAAVWTYLLASSLLGFVIAKLAGYPQALEKMIHSGLAGQYALLIGGPIGAAIAAKGIVGGQVSKGTNTKTSGSPNPAQLVQNDEGEADLGDLQYVLFNLVAMVFFVGSIIQSPLLGLPRIPDILLGLTSVSAAGYVAKKALPANAPTAKLEPSEGPPDTEVTIAGVNLLNGKPPEGTPVAVLFGNHLGVDPRPRPRPDGSDEIKVRVPPLPVSTYSVVLVLPAPEGTASGALSVTAGTFRIT